MSVEVTLDVPEAPLSAADVIRVAEAALALGERPELELGVVLCDDPTLAELHGRFLDDPSETDVMAFDLGDEGGGPGAEVYVSVERARAVARERDRRPEDELALYVAHGVLHLCGHDDHSEEGRKAMRRAEKAVLETLGFAPDPDFHAA